MAHSVHEIQEQVEEGKSEAFFYFDMKLTGDVIVEQELLSYVTLQQTVIEELKIFQFCERDINENRFDYKSLKTMMYTHCTLREKYKKVCVELKQKIRNILKLPLADINSKQRSTVAIYAAAGGSVRLEDVSNSVLKEIECNICKLNVAAKGLSDISECTLEKSLDKPTTGAARSRSPSPMMTGSSIRQRGDCDVTKANVSLFKLLKLPMIFLTSHCSPGLFLSIDIVKKEIDNNNVSGSCWKEKILNSIEEQDCVAEIRSNCELSQPHLLLDYLIENFGRPHFYESVLCEAHNKAGKIDFPLTEINIQENLPNIKAHINCLQNYWRCTEYWLKLEAENIWSHNYYSKLCEMLPSQILTDNFSKLANKSLKEKIRVVDDLWQKLHLLATDLQNNVGSIKVKEPPDRGEVHFSGGRGEEEDDDDDDFDW